MTIKAIIYSDSGETLLDLKKAKKVGDQLVLQGNLMGGWDSTMYVPPESVLGSIMVLFNIQVIWLMICLPVYLMRNWGIRKKQYVKK